MAQPNLQGLSLPIFKTWGRKRHLRCATTLPSSTPWDVGPNNQPDSDVGKSLPSPPFHEGFDQINNNLMAHLHRTADGLDPTVPQRPEQMGDEDAAHVEGHPIPPVAPRPRRSAHRLRRDASPSPPLPPAPTTRSSRARSLAARAEEKRRRFSVTLSREEIDEDFYALTGRRAPGRPKRRPPAVRKHVNVLFPGLGLSEVAADSYDVAPPRVRSRGR